ncbi:DNA primase [Kribbella aluminosa]|uniref:DNA primase n=1 Tax=Kribbella aluminosa TaxID=416017 RepID=A0ABS4UJD2_9ACTN|nr:DNA primase [Kribbella aluminosa]
MNEDLRQLREATVIAAQFYRSELLQTTTGGWPLGYLKEAGVDQVLSADSEWKVGYAPDTLTSLVDHLAAENFSYSTMERAGLVIRTARLTLWIASATGWCLLRGTTSCGRPDSWESGRTGEAER